MARVTRRSAARNCQQTKWPLISLRQTTYEYAYLQQLTDNALLQWMCCHDVMANPTVNTVGKELTN